MRHDRDHVELLQWAMPRLGLRWDGFRTVDAQVLKRLDRRVKALGLADVTAYRRRLVEDATEWTVLDQMCRVTISRFFRDRAVFEGLRSAVLPELARAAERRGSARLRAWSAGCASGEEPYSLAILFRFGVAPTLAGCPGLEIIATDSEGELLERARRARYQRGTLREVPPDWLERAFVPEGGELCLRQELKGDVELRCEDVRAAMPEAPLDLVLCRNLAFSYFGAPVQERILEEISRRLSSPGFLVIGAHEALPAQRHGLQQVGALPIFRS